MLMLLTRLASQPRPRAAALATAPWLIAALLIAQGGAPDSPWPLMIAWLASLAVLAVALRLPAPPADGGWLLDRAGTGKLLVEAGSGRILRANPRLAELTGYTAGELAGKPITALLSAEDRAAAERALELIAQDRLGTSAVEWSIRRKDGTRLWALVSAAAAPRGEDGGRRILVELQDVSERHAELERLAQAEERARVALDASRIGVWEWDVRRDALSWSERIYELHGIAPGAFDGRLASYVALLHPDDHELVRDSVRLALEQKQTFKLEVRAVLPCGGVRWLSTNARTLFDPEGRPTRMVGVVSDCTPRRRAEEALVAAKEAADAASRAKSQFLANMSHEIRTPLGAIVGFTEFLLDPAQPAGDRQECVAAIRRNGELLAELVNDVLDLSKVEAGGLEVERLPFAPAEMLEGLAQSLGLRARDKGLALVVDVDPSVPQDLVTDPTRLRQILVNVVGNAIKFTERGEVRVSARLEDGALQITVTDTGPGIAPAQQQRIFQPFSQGDSSTTRRYGGTGLGLTLSRRLARALGGDLVLAASAPSGSRFVATVAVEAPVAPARTERPARATAAAPERRLLQGLTVLVVEDAPDNQLLIGRILRCAGARVELAEDGESGVSAAVSLAPDVVLMDVQMPGGLDGYQATGRLRAMGFRQPIVALTAHALAGERQRALDAGCDDYLTKPVRRESLVETVARLAPAPGNPLRASAPAAPIPVTAAPARPQAADAHAN